MSIETEKSAEVVKQGMKKQHGVHRLAKEEEEDERATVPKWLQELEAKRETKKLLRARLGHEAGAGSPCLQCKDTCPGLDLHFWRKICKNCKCAKENHDVQEDDLHGWLQFQLLGSSSKLPTEKIRLPGRNSDLELEWTPKGSKEAVEKYLQSVPSDRLPIKGSNAALERKQMLQKQIPIHDVDPSMCHALTEEETRQMNDYVNHLKQTSVGVGQLVSYSPQKMLAQQQHFRPISAIQPEAIYANVPHQQRDAKHDYENIDAFGNHKLAASLEEIQRQQESLECGELLDKFGNPLRAQYALLLDQSGLPLKDSKGKPIKATLDLFGHPIFDLEVSEKISPLAKASFAMLLDKNGAPILGLHGNPIKNEIVTSAPVQYYTDRFGNEVKPAFGVILDEKSQPLLHENGPIRVPLDIYGKPILDKRLGDLLYAAKYVGILDENAAPIIDPNGSPVKFPIWGSQSEIANCGVFLDEYKRLLLDVQGRPIVAHLDFLKTPIIDDSIVKALNGQIPHYSVLLDPRGLIVEAQQLDVNNKQFPSDLKPYTGVLLDEHECAIKDSTGAPIKVHLDHFLRPKYELGVSERLRGQKPEYVMVLDRNGAPILDKYTCPIKKLALPQSEPLGPPSSAILLDHNEQPILDSLGRPVRSQVDILGRPILENNFADKKIGVKPKFVMHLDQYGAPIKDQLGTFLISPVLIIEPQLSKSSTGNLPDLVTPQWAKALKEERKPHENTSNGAQLNGNPAYDRLIKMDGTKPQDAQILDNPTQFTNALNQKASQDKTKIGQPTDNLPNFVIDKYGNRIDPTTGRPIQGSALLDLTAIQKALPIEDNQIATTVNIGSINDIEYPTFEGAKYGASTSIGSSNINEEEYDAIPECHKCKKMIDDNALVIQIDRSEALWHSDCFKCAACNQNLVDLFYFYHEDTDDIYCGRDIAKIRGIPRCHACDELIFVKEYCLAEEKTYHVKHFCCFECDTPLAGQEYVIADESVQQPVCIPCYDNLKADKCLSCGNVIGAHEQGANLNGDHFHADDQCFACRTCCKALLGAKFLYRNKKLFCSSVCFQQDCS